jgi:hypothetical protein
VPGHIRWSESPELSGYKARPKAFAECGGVLHVVIKPHLYRLVDGEQPRWETVYTLPGETDVRAMPSAASRPMGEEGVEHRQGDVSVRLANVESTERNP